MKNCDKCEYSHKANSGHKGFVCECECHGVLVCSLLEGDYGFVHSAV